MRFKIADISVPSFVIGMAWRIHQKRSVSVIMCQPGRKTVKYKTTSFLSRGNLNGEERIRQRQRRSVALVLAGGHLTLRNLVAQNRSALVETYFNGLLLIVSSRTRSAIKGTLFRTVRSSSNTSSATDSLSLARSVNLYSKSS